MITSLDPQSLDPGSHKVPQDGLGTIHLMFAWPAAGNPTIQVNNAADVFSDISLEGNFLFVILYFIIVLVFNIFDEELNYDWIANGILFTLKQVYQRWLYPGILVGGLSFVFAAGPLGSLPLAMLYYWVCYFLFN